MGVSYSEVETGENCIVCLQRKQSRQLFKNTGGRRAKQVLELVHSDLCGPMPDDFSRKIFVYLLTNKSEVFNKFKSFKALVENQTGYRIKKIRTDNGTECVNQALSF